MWELPQKQDRKQHPTFETQRITRGGPTDQRRYGAGKSADHRRKRRTSFQRRVCEDVTGDDRQTEQCTQWIYEYEKIHLRGDRYTGAEGQRLPRRKLTRRQWSRGGAAHQPVQISFRVLIERRDA